MSDATLVPNDATKTRPNRHDGDRHDRVGEAHERLIEPAAEDRRDHAPHDAEPDRDGGGAEGDAQSQKARVGHATEDVAAEVIGSEEVPARSAGCSRSATEIALGSGLMSGARSERPTSTASVTAAMANDGPRNAPGACAAYWTWGDRAGRGVNGYLFRAAARDAQAGVENPVEDVGHQRREDEGDGGEQDDGLDHGVVPLEDGVDDLLPESRPGEDHFDDRDTAEHRAHRDSQGGQCGGHRVGEDVLHHRRSASSVPCPRPCARSWCGGPLRSRRAGSE